MAKNRDVVRKWSAPVTYMTLRDLCGYVNVCRADCRYIEICNRPIKKPLAEGKWTRVRPGDRRYLKGRKGVRVLIESPGKQVRGEGGGRR